MFRRKTLITYLGIYFFAISTVVRFVTKLRGDPFLWPVSGLLAVSFLLMVIEPWLFRRSRFYTYLYLAVQTGLVIILAILPPLNDYFASLFFSLTLQAMNILPVRIGFRWTSAFAAVMGVFMIHALGWAVGSPLILIYAGAYFFFGSYAAFIRQAEDAHHENQRLLGELQTAHQQLYIYTAQAEELAVVQERNRLARSLHDSVSQTVFSMTMMAEAARILFDRDPVQAASQLGKLQALAKSALAEMRSLIFDLRPTAVAQQGLIPALRHHIATLERQHGLVVALHVTGESHLPDEQAEQLFSIIQEVLNNVAKHAWVDKASVNLQFEDRRIFLRVQSRGRGFVPEAMDAEEKHIGLSSIRKHVEMMGGTFSVDSRPGEGMCVTVEVTSADGGEKNG
jgi:signal transduction histidine kinase